jgi:hypothetical protein
MLGIPAKRSTNGSRNRVRRRGRYAVEAIEMPSPIRRARKRAGTAVRNEPTMKTRIPNVGFPEAGAGFHTGPQNESPKFVNLLEATSSATIATRIAAGTSAGMNGIRFRIRNGWVRIFRGVEEEGGRGSRPTASMSVGVSVTT